MQYKCKMTVIDKKVFADLQEKYLEAPKSGACPFYEVGAEYLFERYGDEDTYLDAGQGRALCRGMGLFQSLRLHGSARRLNHARLDERRTHDDCLL